MALKRIRVAWIAALTGMIIGLGAGVATAAVSYTAWTPRSTNSLAYEYRAFINVEGSIYGGAQVRGATQNLPASWASVLPRVYRSGAVCATGTTAYNSSSVSAFSNSVSGNCGAGLYTSSNTIGLWNQGSYLMVSRTSLGLSVNG